jgi:hypothetical protein
MEGNLGDPEIGLKLTILLSCLRITFLGHLPLSKEALSVIAIVGVRRVRR